MKESEVYSNRKNILESFFNKTSDHWHNLYSGDSFIDVHMCERKELVLSMVDEVANNESLKILDLGCGSGLLSKELIKKGHTVVGADIAIDLLSLLNSSLKDSSQTNFMGCIISDAERICVADNFFDIVLCIGVLQYQTNDGLILKEISRVLKDQGVCIVTFPNLLRINYLFDPYYYIKYIARITRVLIRKVLVTDNPGGFKEKISGGYTASHPYDKKYFLKDIKHLLTGNGYAIIRCEAFGYGPFTIFKNAVFSNARSIQLSLKLRKWAQKKNSAFLTNTANRWVFASRKQMKINPA